MDFEISLQDCIFLLNLMRYSHLLMAGKNEAVSI